MCFGSKIAKEPVVVDFYPRYAVLARYCDLRQQRVSIAVYASPVLTTIGMSVRPYVCHTLALSENDAS